MKKKVIECELIVQKEYSSTESAPITVRLKNNSKKPIRLLVWNTPFDGLNSDFLDIRPAKFNAKRIPYQGILVKRGNPKEDNYLNISPDGSTEVPINIFDGYSIPREGEYTIRVSFFLSYHQNNSEEIILCKSDKHVINFANTTIKKSGSFNANFKRVKKDLFKDDIDLNKDIFEINTDEIYEDLKEKNIRDIIKKSLECIKKALEHLSSKISSPTYIEWFGTFAPYRWQEVYFSCLDMYIYLTNCTVKVIDYGDCCDEGTKNEKVAYVFVGKPEIYLCKSFWDLEDCGRDSKLGVFLHELSHVAANTHDIGNVINEKLALLLAKDFPQKATWNANNYEFFFEDICC